ncbi:probable tyrosine phosphatase protein [Stappia aggregata IAM 12614]|uniref:protein-tyrosine-phosphatase n=1 Tax=Roseibium aggregatum (strain ATCC 25650 / DSM 13394 / JCM 20685 / NBRC 16684 / NCIMB 2208 / IAM 12614 / B1) TaxID=384765 RepID=A0NZR4_ROSAI|nr:probable tyrosine phosphatase protein [Stappia aggregata IAM 12614] [Roseibium aggregatum IAM 12614]
MLHTVLFVCLGNICRSPLAEGVFRSIVSEAGLEDRFEIDSAGTGAWHVGNPPDPRSIEIAAQHRIDISSQRARQVSAGDFRRFETIVAMDRDNLAALKRLGGAGSTGLRLLLNTPPQDVPDPYYGGPDGFEQVYQLVRTGGERLLQDLTARV